MLFTSAIFAFLYLPVVFAGFFALGHYSERGAAAWLFLASTAFYGYWMPEFTLLLLSSIGWNFWVGIRIGSNLQQVGEDIRREEKRREEKRREELRDAGLLSESLSTLFCWLISSTRISLLIT